MLAQQKQALFSRQIEENKIISLNIESEYTSPT